jgi:hypothetical protein
VIGLLHPARGEHVPYRHPRDLWLAGELLNGSTGKVLKREIAVLTPIGS